MMSKKADVEFARWVGNVDRQQKRIDSLSRQVVCGVKGHDLRYVGKDRSVLSGERDNPYSIYRLFTPPGYVFQCERCGLKVIYAQDELSAAEVKSLKGLGVISD